MTQPEKQNKYGVIFDMDGVLVDSGPAHHEAFRRFGKTIGTDMSADFFRRCMGYHNRQIFPLWLGAHLTREQIEEYAEKKEAIYREIAWQFVKPLDGVIDLIRSLGREGFLLAVGSSGPSANVDLALKILGIRDAFQALSTGDDVPAGKPDPAIFLNAAKKLGLKSRNCVVVEDAVAGINAGKAAKMPVIAITTTFPRDALDEAGADKIIDSMKQLSIRDFEQLLSEEKSQ